MERWGFIVPWCSVLRKRVQYYRIACEEDVWDIHKHSLDVILPTRRGDELNEYSDGREEVGTGDDNYAIAHATRHDKEAAFQAKFKRVREALALLAAVAHIDQTAWKYLLKQHCEVSFGDKVLKDGSEKCERELPAHFVLHMDHGGISGMPCNINSVDMEPTELVDIDLVQLCGVQQWENPSAEYLETLVKIAALDPHFRPERKAVEVIIPVQVEYYSERDKVSQWELATIAKACRVINEQWEAYERGTEKTDVLPGSYRCTFMMGPINAEVTDGMALDLMSPAMEAVLRNNTWFSELALSAEMHNHVVIIDDTEVYSEYVDEDQARTKYRQLMTEPLDALLERLLLVITLITAMCFRSKKLTLRRLGS